MNSKNIKRYILISISVFCILACTSFLLNEGFSQPLSNPLRGDKVLDDLDRKGLTAQKAYNGIKSFNDLLESGTMFGNEPNILYTVAKYKIYLGYKHKETEYVKNNTNQYTYFEQGDFYIYNGDDLLKIVNDYPESANADDAAFMLATMETKVECEGEPVCYIKNSVERISPFLKRFPNSPFVYNAIVEDINKTLKPFVNEGAQSRISSMNESEKHELNFILNNYFNLLTSLKSEDKLYGLFYVARVYENIGLKTRAGEIYKMILDNYINFPNYEKVKFQYQNLKK